MPGTTQEQLRPGLPLLAHHELVDLDRQRFGLSPILDPREIPIHPKVFRNPEFYMPEFVTEVWERVPASISRDVTIISEKIGRPVPVILSEEGVLGMSRMPYLRDDALYSDFKLSASKEKKSVWVEPTDGQGMAEAINLGLDSSGHNNWRIKSGFGRRTVSQDKLEEYVDPETEEDIRTWYSHNVGMAQLPLLLVLRNFAIQFNNLGLQRLGQV